MTHFKELARIESAIEHRNKAELQWADWYCRMRQQIAVRKNHAEYWRGVREKVVDALSRTTPTEQTAKKRAYKHWTKFTTDTQSMRKSRRRSDLGECIACGKKRCVCKKRSESI